MLGKTLMLRCYDWQAELAGPTDGVTCHQRGPPFTWMSKYAYSFVKRMFTDVCPHCAHMCPQTKGIHLTFQKNKPTATAKIANHRPHRPLTKAPTHYAQRPA